MGIKHIIVGVEGEVTEVASMRSVLGVLRQQAPHGYANLEVVLLSLKGNHGHSHILIEKFEELVREYEKNPDNCVSSDDEVIKVLVCDYDDMHEHGVNERDFRAEVEEAGAIVIISKPKFELFVAGLFWGEDDLMRMLKSGKDLGGIIKEGIKKYNDGCDFDFQKIPPYSKRHHQADNWFATVFNLDPVFLERAKNMSLVDQDFYTEIPRLIKMIAEFFE